MLTGKMPPASGGVLTTMLIRLCSATLTLVRDDASIRQGTALSARVLELNVQKNRSGGC